MTFSLKAWPSFSISATLIVLVDSHSQGALEVDLSTQASFHDKLAPRNNDSLLDFCSEAGTSPSISSHPFFSLSREKPDTSIYFQAWKHCLSGVTSCSGA